MKNRLVLLVISIGILSFSACNNRKSPTGAIMEFKDTTKISVGGEQIEDTRIINLKDSIIRYGDARSYNELSSFYLLNGQQEDLLYYSLLLANRNNNSYACKDVYYILSVSRIGVRFADYDDLTKNTAIYYLLRSYELGYKEAIFDIQNVFGKNVAIPKSIDYSNRLLKVNLD